MPNINKLKIIKNLKIPKNLITSKNTIDDYLSNTYPVSDLSRTITKCSLSYFLGIEMMKNFLNKKEYNNMIKNLLPLSKNALIYLFREGFNFESQKLKIVYSVFNGLGIDVVKKTAKNIKLNPYFENTIMDIRYFNNLGENDYIDFSILTRDLEEVVKIFVKLNDPFKKLKLHITDNSIYGNKMQIEDGKLSGIPKIDVKSKNKHKWLNKIQESKPASNLVYISDNERIKNTEEIKYFIKIKKCYGI